MGIGSTVTLTLEDYNSLQVAKAAAENDRADLHKQLIELRLAKGTEQDITALNTAVRRCAEIARFAVANLPPESIKGWPWQQLMVLATQIEGLPDAGPDDKACAIDLRAFARDCEKHERRRAAMPKIAVEEIDMRNGVA